MLYLWNASNSHRIRPTKPLIIGVKSIMFDRWRAVDLNEMLIKLSFWQNKLWAGNNFHEYKKIVDVFIEKVFFPEQMSL